MKRREFITLLGAGVTASLLNDLSGATALAQQSLPNPVEWLHAGPMLEHSEITATEIWLQTKKSCRAEVRFWKQGKPETAREPKLLTSADLIISTIGNWSAESMLNEWHQLQSNPPPTLYGWTEAFALAGHAVGIFKGNGCFQCQTNQYGSPLLRVTEWNGTSTKKQEPACGIMYQPYGPIELNNTVTLISELAIDILLSKINTSTERVWASRQSSLQASGADWTNEWLNLVNNNRDGGISATRVWKKQNNCPVCSGGEV